MDIQTFNRAQEIKARIEYLNKYVARVENGYINITADGWPVDTTDNIRETVRTLLRIGLANDLHKLKDELAKL